MKSLSSYVSKLILWATSASPPDQTLTVFNFHGILESPLAVPDCCFIEFGTFKQYLAIIQKSYCIVSLDSGISMLLSGSLKKPLAMITFDDGFASLVRLVLPLLKETSIPVSCFINTDMIDSDDTFWFCRVNQIISETRRKSLDWNAHHCDLYTVSDREQASHAIQESLKYMPAGRLREELTTLATLLEVDISAPVDKTSPFRVLSRAQIAEASDSGLVEFGGHAHSHAILSQLSHSQQEVQILSNIEKIRNLTGRQPNTFAYPNGRPDDYDENSIRILQKAGVKAAFTTDLGRCEKGADVYRLPRVFVGPNATASDLISLV